MGDIHGSCGDDMGVCGHWPKSVPMYVLSALITYHLGTWTFGVGLMESDLFCLGYWSAESFFNIQILNP